MKDKDNFRMAPPLTRRFCTNCKEITYFKYDPALGHSACTHCKAYSNFSIDVSRIDKDFDFDQAKQFQQDTVKMVKKIRRLKNENNRLNKLLKKYYDAFDNLITSYWNESNHECRKLKQNILLHFNDFPDIKKRCKLKK